MMICILSLLCSLGCQEKVDNTDQVDEKTKIKDDETGRYKINDSKDGIVIDDLLESVQMLDKTAEEIGISQEK